ncbi:MAG: UvrD-helicase domain-containing protein [Vampirovibrionales bacterium]|nr:UvrD-helicase domain-containing protein [Vampirovibrionales bacterium]
MSLLATKDFVGDALNYSQSDLLHGLNPAQQAAVTFGHGPLLVLAGAGSGKTKVLTCRIAQLLQHTPPPLGPVAPGEIMAVTFTNKAAKEMRTRLAALVGQAETEGIWLGTFHSICGRILRRDIMHYKNPSGRQWTSNYVIYDTDESLSVLKQCLKALNRDEKLYPPKALRAQISALKNDGLDAYAYASSARNFREEQLAQVFDAYEATLAENNALDFDDLLLICARLFQQRPDVLEQYHERFRHILVDEFQDTNNLQSEWMRALALGAYAQPNATSVQPDAAFWSRRTLTVVGDVDQSIYSWRGANFRILLSFQQDFPTATLIKLETNYRSTGNIIELANTLIENNTERLPKTLNAHKGKGTPVACIEAEDDRDEAYKVTHWISQTARREGKTLRDCCILYRTNVQSRALEEILLAKGIPYTLVGGVKFYERREVRDVLAYLITLYNPYDAQSVKRSLNAPKRGIGKVTLETLEGWAKSKAVSFYEALSMADHIDGLKPAAKKAIGTYVALIEALRHKMTELPLGDLMAMVIETSGYLQSLKEDDAEEAESRMANLEELIRVAQQFVSESAAMVSKNDTLEPASDNASAFYETLGNFLTHMALLSDLDTANTNDPATDKLVLMTVHAAKGLEFPIVAICGMEEGRFPHFRSIDSSEGIEEERRLMYVAITRAEQHLLLTFARRRFVLGEMQYATPSRFMKELPLHLIEGDFSLDRRSASGYGSDRNDSRFGSQYGRPSPTAATAGRRPTSTVSKPVSAQPVSAGKTMRVFTTGDTVQHPSFGKGKVVQVLGSGSSTLYSIEFEGVKGKKVFDPKFVKLD